MFKWNEEDCFHIDDYNGTKSKKQTVVLFNSEETTD